MVLIHSGELYLLAAALYAALYTAPLKLFFRKPPFEPGATNVSNSVADAPPSESVALPRRPASSPRTNKNKTYFIKFFFSIRNKILPTKIKVSELHVVTPIRRKNRGSFLRAGSVLVHRITMIWLL